MHSFLPVLLKHVQHFYEFCVILRDELRRVLRLCWNPTRSILEFSLHSLQYPENLGERLRVVIVPEIRLYICSSEGNHFFWMRKYYDLGVTGVTVLLEVIVRKQQFPLLILPSVR